MTVKLPRILTVWGEVLFLFVLLGFFSHDLKTNKLLVFSGCHLGNCLLFVFPKITFSFLNPTYGNLLNILYYSVRKDLQAKNFFSSLSSLRVYYQQSQCF